MLLYSHKHGKHMQSAKVTTGGRRREGPTVGGGVEGYCLRRILRIRWKQRIGNAEIAQGTGINNINRQEEEMQIVGQCVKKMEHLNAALK